MTKRSRKCPDCSTVFGSVQSLGVCPKCNLRFDIDPNGNVTSKHRPEKYSGGSATSNRTEKQSEITYQYVDANESSGWDELRFILKAVAPFAVLVWSATLCWSLTESTLWTVIAPLLVTSISSATLFCNPERVSSVYAGLLKSVAFLVVGALACCVLYFGVKIVFAALAWTLMFPVRHPFYFVGGLILFFVILALGSEDEKSNAKPSSSGSIPKPTKHTAWKEKHAERESRRRNDSQVRCPSCGSTSVTSNRQGVDPASAVAGAFIFGPVGLMFGGMGKDNIIITCLKCGKKFSPGGGG